MGADMMIVTANAPRFAADSGIPADEKKRLSVLKQIGRTRARNVPAAALRDALSTYEFDFAGNQDVIDGLNGGPEVEVTDEMIHAARECLESFNPFQSRAVCGLRLRGRDYFATGGLSTGDLPPCDYDAVLLLDEVDLWGEPVSAWEVTQALAALAVATQ